MTEYREPKPLADVVLIKTPNSWWRVGMDDPVGAAYLSERARNAVRPRNLHRVADVRDLDLEQFAAGRGVGPRIAEEIALLREVLRYRTRVSSPDRAAFEAALPCNRMPPSWQTVLKEDRLETLSLSKRARGAFSAAGAATAGDALDLTLAELRAQRSIGRSTMIELEALYRALHHRFSDGSRPRGESLDGYFEEICPCALLRFASHEQAMLSRYLGLHVSEGQPFDPWPAERAIATDLGVAISAVRATVSKARRGWCHPTRRHIRSELKRILEARGGVTTAAEMATDLLARRGSAASREVCRLRAAAVVRAGLEGEMSRGPRAARFRADRRSGEVFVAMSKRSVSARPV